MQTKFPVITNVIYIYILCAVMRSYAQHIIMYFVSSENEVTFMQKNCYIQWRGAMRAKDHVSLMVTKYS